MESWRELILETMGDVGDSWDDIECTTLTEAELDEDFDRSFSVTEGRPFTVWTAKYVYFPVCYDGSEWAGCVRRNPDPDIPLGDQGTKHWGGG